MKIRLFGKWFLVIAKDGLILGIKKEL